MSNLKKILSIDGGGIRGIIPGQIMVEMENEFGIKVSDYFDLITGTSTGGILACAYLIPDKNDPKKPKFTAEQVVGLYFERGGDIFDTTFFHKLRSMKGLLDEKYPDKGIKSALKEYFGEVWLKDLLKPTVITSYDIENRKGHFFYQHKAKNPAYNFKVKDVCRATSAAPTFFECARVKPEKPMKPKAGYALIDGGVFVNNPALVSYAEGRSIFTNKKGEDARAQDMKILSIGTGQSIQHYGYGKAKDWGMVQWVKPLIDIMMSGSAEVADYELGKIYGTVKNPNQYIRINGNLKETKVDPAMDCATDKNMQLLKVFGTAIFKKNKRAIGEWLEC
ncbi:MAG: patatin [Cytophagales bacterium]|nr:patatin [Cytophagales bacterium]